MCFDLISFYSFRRSKEKKNVKRKTAWEMFDRKMTFYRNMCRVLLKSNRHQNVMGDIWRMKSDKKIQATVCDLVFFLFFTYLLFLKENSCKIDFFLLLLDFLHNNIRTIHLMSPYNLKCKQFVFAFKHANKLRREILWHVLVYEIPNDLFSLLRKWHRAHFANDSNTELENCELSERVSKFKL